MEQTSRYGIAAIQTAHPSAFTREQIKANMDRSVELVHFAKAAGDLYGSTVKLVVFPEIFIHGFPFHTSKEYMDNGIYATIPDGPEIRQFVDLAREYDIYIQTGSMFECDPRYPGHLFNTACIVGPEGMVLKYRKINPWIPAETSTSPHQIKGYSEPLFPVVDTPIGKLGVVICYDAIFPETMRQLAFNGAEVIIRTSAYMHPWTSGPTNWWKVISQARSIENVVYSVHVNLGASVRDIPGFSFPGGTCVVDYEGRVLSEICESGEHIVYGHIDLGSQRAWRERTYAHLMPAHLRTEAFTYLREPGFPGATHGPGDMLTAEQLMEMIDRSRRGKYGSEKG